MEGRIQKDGVGVSEGLENDILKIMGEQNLEGTPHMKFFWEQQMKLLQAKKMGRRYHPQIIRFALSLHGKSAAAFREIRESGALVLPSERDLYDYKNYFKPKVYRISNLLIHSGATFQDITRLNKLGVCMCPKSTIEIQRSMGKHFDAKVLNWKSSIEDNKNAILLLNEILEKQTPLLEEDSMDLETELDLREVTTKSYKYFNPHVYKKLVASLISAEEQTLLHVGALSFSKEALQCQIRSLESKNLPLYK